MRRAVEWSLAASAAGLGVVGVVLIAANLVLVMKALGDSWWPSPGQFLLEMALLGLAGLAGVLATQGAGPWRWHKAAWIASGGLAALGAIGWYGVGLVFFALAPAALFGLAALVVVWRRRRLRDGIGAFVLGAAITSTVMAVLTAVTRL